MMLKSVVGLSTMFLLFCYKKSKKCWENGFFIVKFVSSQKFKTFVKLILFGKILETGFNTLQKKGANTHFDNYEVLVIMMMIW